MFYITKIRLITKSKFIGKQLARLRNGQHYYILITSTISAISLLTIAFKLNFITVIILFPIFLSLSFIIGYITDITNINSMDILKNVEIHNRFINTADLKQQQFRLLQTKLLIHSLTKTPLTELEIDKQYNDYLKKWKL